MMDKPIRIRSEFLEEVLVSLRKSGKSLKHAGLAPTIERFVNVYEETTEERLSLSFVLTRKQTMEVQLWADRWVEVRANERLPKSGWKFNFEAGGRLVGENGARDIVSAIKDAALVMFEATEDDQAAFEAVWRPLLAIGPSAI